MLESDNSDLSISAVNVCRQLLTLTYQHLIMIQKLKLQSDSNLLLIAYATWFEYLCPDTRCTPSQSCFL